MLHQPLSTTPGNPTYKLPLASWQCSRIAAQQHAKAKAQRGVVVSLRSVSKATVAWHCFVPQCGQVCRLPCGTSTSMSHSKYIAVKKMLPGATDVADCWHATLDFSRFWHPAPAAAVVLPLLLMSHMSSMLFHTACCTPGQLPFCVWPLVAGRWWPLPCCQPAATTAQLTCAPVCYCTRAAAG